MSKDSLVSHARGLVVPIIVNTQSHKALDLICFFSKFPRTVKLALTLMFPVMSGLERPQTDSLLLHLLCHFHSEHQGWVMTKRELASLLIKIVVVYSPQRPLYLEKLLPCSSLNQQEAPHKLQLF